MSSASVPAVNVSDLRVMWNYNQEMKALHPGADNIAVGAALWKSMCSPGADVAAISCRYGVLAMIEKLWAGGEPRDDVFEAAAKMSLSWPEIGVVQKGLPFDFEGLYVEVLKNKVLGRGAE